MPGAAVPESSGGSQKQQRGKGKAPEEQKGKVIKQKAKTEKKQDAKLMPWTPIIQGHVSRLPIVFTNDAEYYFAAVLSSVKIFSRATGQLVSTLSSAASTSSQKSWSNRQITENHSGNITGLCINPANALQLLTCSIDGTIKIWDYLDAVLVRTIDVGLPISHMAAHSMFQGSVFVALKKPKGNTSPESSSIDPFDFNGRCNSIIQLVSLSSLASKGGNAMRPQNMLRVGKARRTTTMALTADGSHLVLIGKRKIHVAQTKTLKAGFSKIISDEELTCLAMHPSGKSFATGDTRGQIRLWYFLEDMSGNKKTAEGSGVAPNVLLHWHSHAVSALTFTPNGANLISGGEESVMVLWQLAMQSKEFVPRLGGAKIESICVSPNVQGKEEEFVASLADGTITFIGSIDLRIRQSFSQVLIDSSRQLLGEDYFSADVTFPLAIHPISGQLVANAGHPSTLQFYDMETESVVSQMEIVPSNRVSRPDEIPLDPPRIEKVVFSSKGEFMATIDAHGLSRGPCLKIWSWDRKGEIYKLNSRIDDPHKGAAITSVSFSPRPTASTSSSPPSILLLTTGSDCKAHTWRQISQEIKGGKKEEFWIARSVFDYRDLPIGDSAWEPNGSLLALSHEDYVTIWEPITNSLQQVIPIQGKSKGIIFAGKGGRYIVALSDQSLLVWDIVLGQISWEMEMISNWVVKYSQDHFCTVTTKQGKTLISSFSPTSSTPVDDYMMKVPIRQVSESQSIMSSIPTFLAITKDFDIVEVGASADPSAGLIGHSAQSLRGKQVKRRTLFDDLLGPQGMPLQPEEDTAPVVKTTFRKRPLLSDGGNGILDVASHLLPPISVMYDSLMDQIIPKEPEKEETVVIADENTVKQPVDDAEESEEEAENMAADDAGSIERLRHLARMDMTSISTLFARQATIAPAQNGAIAAKQATIVPAENGATDAPTESQAPPAKIVSNGKQSTSVDSVLSKTSSKSSSSSNGKVNGVKANGHKKAIVEVVIDTPAKKSSSSSSSSSKKAASVVASSPRSMRSEKEQSSIDDTPQRHSTRPRKRKEIIDYD